MHAAIIYILSIPYTDVTLHFARDAVHLPPKISSVGQEGVHAEKEGQQKTTWDACRRVLADLCHCVRERVSGK